MRAVPAQVGARGVDSLPFSQAGTRQQAIALADNGIDFFVGYLGAMSPERLAHVLLAGLGFMPVTFAGEYFDGAADELAQLQALGIPPGCTVWLDLEGDKSFKWPAADLIRLINEWATKLAAAGYQPGLYIGSPQPLTGDELSALKVVRYWKAPSRIGDRTGKIWDGPSGIGHCMFQMWPQMMWRSTGVFVDVNIIGQDYRGRVPSWVVPSP